MNKDITGIILAAGMGTRLKDLTKETPKALIEVQDRPLIQYAINFQKRLGINKIIIVGGFYFNDLKAVINSIDPAIEVFQNTDYKKGNLYTLDTVLEKINTSFFLMNVDHIYHKDIAEKVRSQFIDDIVAFTDDDRQLGDDDMKVLTDNNRKIKKISKQLDEFNLGYVGMTYCDETCLDQYKQMVEKTKVINGENAVVENVLQNFADFGASITVGDISGFGWHEIDFQDELEKARVEISKNPNLYI